MINPILALSVFALIAITLAVLFWPKRGLYWYWHRIHGKSELVDVEDALKHIYDCEYTNRTATVDSLAGCLGIRVGRVVDLVNRLDELELLVTNNVCGSFKVVKNGYQSFWPFFVLRIHFSS